jgi:hypothetical protein
VLAEDRGQGRAKRQRARGVFFASEPGATKRDRLDLEAELIELHRFRFGRMPIWQNRGQLLPEEALKLGRLHVKQVLAHRSKGRSA